MSLGRREGEGELQHRNGVLLKRSTQGISVKAQQVPISRRVKRYRVDLRENQMPAGREGRMGTANGPAA